MPVSFRTDIAGAAPVTGRLDRNIEALLDRRRREEQHASLQDRIALKIARTAGSMTFVYVHVLVFGLWILINTGLLPVVRPFDPSMVILAVVATIEALFISVFVMISQNRTAEIDDKRADLNLQISLLSEHETTQILKLLAEIAERLDVQAASSAEIEDLKRDVNPEAVLDAMERKADGKE